MLQHALLQIDVEVVAVWTVRSSNALTCRHGSIKNESVLTRLTGVSITTSFTGRLTWKACLVDWVRKVTYGTC